MWAEPRSADQQFRDLDGVECGAFAELIGADEEVVAAVECGAVALDRILGLVGADASDEGLVGSGGLEGGGKVVAGAVVDDAHAGGVLEGGADVGFGGGFGERDGDGLGVGAADGDADAGGGDAEGGIVEDAAHLVDHLLFFDVAAGVGVDGGVMAEDVEGAGFGEDARFGVVAFEDGAGLGLELLHGGFSGAAGGLVGGDVDALESEASADGGEGDGGDDGGAVGIGGDAGALCAQGRERFWVDLGDNERAVRVHSKGGGVIDDIGASLGGEGGELARGVGGGAAEEEVEVADGVGGCFFDGVWFALDVERFACGARGGEEAEGRDWECALPQDLDKFETDGAGGAEDGNARRGGHGVTIGD